MAIERLDTIDSGGYGDAEKPRNRPGRLGEKPVSVATGTSSTFPR